MWTDEIIDSVDDLVRTRGTRARCGQRHRLRTGVWIALAAILLLDVFGLAIGRALRVRPGQRSGGEADAEDGGR